jgi:tRNA-dihydrouridine synthase
MVNESVQAEYRGYLTTAERLTQRMKEKGSQVGYARFIETRFKEYSNDYIQKDRIDMFIYHIKLFKESKKDFNIIKKYIRTYINGFNGANDIRIEMYKCNSIDELEKDELI